MVNKQTAAAVLSRVLGSAISSDEFFVGILSTYHVNLPLHQIGDTTLAILGRCYDFSFLTLLKHAVGDTQRVCHLKPIAGSLLSNIVLWEHHALVFHTS